MNEFNTLSYDDIFRKRKTFPVTLYFASEDGRDGYERAVRDNEIVNVVRCKNCIHKDGCAISLHLGAHGYCSKGKRRGVIDRE